MKNDFIPKREGDLDAHEENFKTKLAVHAADLEIDPAEVTEVVSTIDLHRNSYSSMNFKRADSKFASEENRIKKVRAINEIRRVAKKIKASKKYTTAIGEDLQIIGPELPVVKSSDKKPVLGCTLNGQEAILKFRRLGTDGINIYSRRAAETEFTFLAISTHSKFPDTRPKLDMTKPEQREYYAYFVESDAEIGQRSNVLKVIVP